VPVKRGQSHALAVTRGDFGSLICRSLVTRPGWSGRRVAPVRVNRRGDWLTEADIPGVRFERAAPPAYVPGTGAQSRDLYASWIKGLAGRFHLEAHLRLCAWYRRLSAKRVLPQWTGGPVYEPGRSFGRLHHCIAVAVGDLVARH
jgi:hypothetical protein